jgi:hypothetical protein
MKKLFICFILMSIFLSVFCTPQMGIEYLGEVDMSHPYNIVTMEGDSLAFYNYGALNQTIGFSRFHVTPSGTVTQPSTFFTYDINPDWGVVDSEPLMFTYKQDMLVAAFQTTEKFLVFLIDENNEDVHVIDRNGMVVTDTATEEMRFFYILNSELGYFTTGSQIYKIDLTQNNFSLFYEGNQSETSYCIYSYCDDYLLMFSRFSYDDGLLVDGDVITQTLDDYGHFGLNRNVKYVIIIITRLVMNISNG